MIQPRTRNFSVPRGSTWNPLLTLFHDAAETQPFDLTGWAIEFDIEGWKTLVVGEGLTVSAARGEVLPTLASTDTSTQSGKVQYRLSISKEGDTFFPLIGVMNFETV